MDYPTSDTEARLADGKFTDGDVTASPVVPPSKNSATYQNMVFDELLNVITAGGLTPSDQSVTQLITAINNVIASAIGTNNTNYVDDQVDTLAQATQDALDLKSDDGHTHLFSALTNGESAVLSLVRGIRIPAAFAADGSWTHKPVSSWSVVKNATGDYTLSFGTSYSSYLISTASVTVAAWVQQDSKTATGVNIKTYRDADSGGTGDILGYDADVFFEVILL
ncbi:hypothetical protein [Oceanobacter antarcticus]|uniref:Phage tail fibre repeat-containing protein n=1 Tax=Oceanobacter antarcticus TaxID=3133425 RepID=A0ABW8NET0_9GAMM